ncbi:MAG: hypothetical protein AMJ37_02065 [Dehalococcoidia bacterium DG_18]|nr:MAG: hypothetical protein AMJ37_02065 [Dehalococcoidia bacterium DG_18]
MLYLIVKLLNLVEALLDHFVNTAYVDFAMTSDYQWIANVSAFKTDKGEETVGAVSTVIHLGSVFLAQLMQMFSGVL